MARALGVTEGAVRHHLRRLAEGREDGRGKPFRAESLVDRIPWLARGPREGVGGPVSGQRPGSLRASRRRSGLHGVLQLGPPLPIRSVVPGSQAVRILAGWLLSQFTS
jgi:hypothetical protein